MKVSVEKIREILGEIGYEDVIHIQHKCEKLNDPLTFLYIYETLRSTYREMKRTRKFDENFLQDCIDYKIKMNFFLSTYDDTVEHVENQNDFLEYVDLYVTNDEFRKKYNLPEYKRTPINFD